MSSYLADPFPRFIDRAEVRTIFEIGSRDGSDAVALDDYYQPERLVVFEANPPAQALCRRTIGSRSTITLIEAAVSDTPGMVSFWPVVSSHQPDGIETRNIGASSLFKASGLYGESYIQTEIKVPAVRADEVCVRLGIQTVDLVCMDVQGAEVSVLRSFGSLLRSVKYIITEATVVNQYVGQAQLCDVNDYLTYSGFRLAAVDMAYWGFGNFLYIHRSVPIPIVGS